MKRATKIGVWSAAAVGTVVGVVGIASSSDSGPDVIQTRKPATISTSTMPAPEKPSPTVMTDTEPSSDETGVYVRPYGGTYDWDGVTVTLSKPATYRPSDTAMSEQGEFGTITTAQKMTVTVKNGTSKPIEPRTLRLSAIAGDVPVGEVFDTARGVNGPPDSNLLPGRTVKYVVAFAAANAKGLVVQVDYGFGNASGTFG